MTDSRFDAADRDALVAAGRALAGSGLVAGSAGNLSVRRGDRMLITPRGGRLERLDPRDLVDVALADGSVAADHASGSRPSSEAPLHRTAYAASGAGAVVHTHSRYATVLGTLVDELPAIHYALAAFGGPVRVAPYATFGSDELAAAVTAALADRRAALMANHGAVVTGVDLDTAVDFAHELEWLATIAYDALAAGTPRLLSDDDLAAVREQQRALQYRGASRP